MDVRQIDLLKLSQTENFIIADIQRKTQMKNVDNISRTAAYLQFYHLYPEIQWSFLASMVSRNAGWNMCDLEGKWFPIIINQETRRQLYLTYERANWLIFHDAYPQLMLYHYSTKLNRPMFHLLKNFRVSTFMQKEWAIFFKNKNKRRLMHSLIINEQNVIEKPVLQQPFYKESVFHSLLFTVQDWFHFSVVLFPTCYGELFGASVNGFTSVSKRIDLGKRLAHILFSPSLYADFYQFANNTTHTGSRHDYEQYFSNPPKRSTPYLRSTFPIIKHHIHEWEDWSSCTRITRKWRKSKVRHIHPIHLTRWYTKKQKQLHRSIKMIQFLSFFHK